MRKTAIATAALTAAALVGLGVPVAQADGHLPVLTYDTPMDGRNPAEKCSLSGGVILAQIRVGGEVVEEFPLSEPGQMSQGGCVSTLTTNELTTAAYVANCKVLEPMFGGYPYAFYGDPNLMAKNRADCVSLLRSFHTSIVG